MKKYVLRVDIYEEGRIVGNYYFVNGVKIENRWTLDFFKATRFTDINEAQKILKELEERDKQQTFRPVRSGVVYEIIEV